MPNEILPSNQIAQKMTREDIYKMLESIADGKIKEQVQQGKEAGDKVLHEIEAGNKALRDQMQALAAGIKQVSPTSHNLAHVGQVLRAIAQSKGSKDIALSHVKAWGEKWGPGSSAERAIKAVQESDFAGGGAALGPAFQAEVFGALRAESVVRKLGVNTINLANGSANLPYVSSGSSGTWAGEGTVVNASSVSFGNLQLRAKKLITLIPISNDFLRDASEQPGTANIVGEDLVSGIAEAEDSALLRGLGTAGGPKGLRYWAASANVVVETKTGGTVTKAEAAYDLLRLQYLTEVQKVRSGPAAYIFSPRTKLALMAARDANNNAIWLPEMTAGTLLGAKWAATAGIPDNLTSSYSEILYAANLLTCIIGEAESVRVEMFDGAAYANASGTVVSAVSQDESVLRAVLEEDFGCRQRGLEVAALYNVDWTSLA